MVPGINLIYANYNVPGTYIHVSRTKQPKGSREEDPEILHNVFCAAELTYSYH